MQIEMLLRNKIHAAVCCQTNHKQVSTSYFLSCRSCWYTLCVSPTNSPNYTADKLRQRKVQVKLNLRKQSM